VAQSGKIPPNARFITPVMAQTFKWYAGRAEVANWKEIPQDAESIVAWWQRIKRLRAAECEVVWSHGDNAVAEHRAAQLRRLAADYQADYAITPATPPLPLTAAYKNQAFTIYRLQ
jgi:hypothetical protein